MKFLLVALASAAVAAAQAVGKLAINNFPITGVVAGNSYTITYTAPDQTQPVTFLLKKGPANNLQTVDTLTSKLYLCDYLLSIDLFWIVCFGRIANIIPKTSTTGGTFVWVPSTTLTNGEDYAMEIKQGTDNNYMGPFPLTGGAAATSSVSSSSTTSTSTSTSTSTTVSSASVSPISTKAPIASPANNGTVPLSTGAVGTVTSLKPTTTNTDAPSGSGQPAPFEGAASGLSASFGAFAGVAVFAGVVAMFA